MSKHVFRIFALTTALLLSSTVQAVDSTELKVTGTIRPTACKPTFLYGGVIDYGTILTETLHPGAYTPLDTKKVAMSVNCSAGTKMAMSLTDNRATTRVFGIVGAIERFNFGLGSVTGKNIGGYDIKFDPLSIVDGQMASNLHSTDQGLTWTSDTSYADTTGTYISLSTDGTTPATGKVFTIVMHVRAVINKPEELPLAQNIPLDGSATIEVKYL